MRLATAGHSSAATIAVMALAREPRIVAAAAMAPVVDIPKRLGEEIVDQLPGDATRFVNQYTPVAVEHFNHPLFIYHTRDDSILPIADVQAFAAKHPGKVTLKVGNSGDHVGALTDGLPDAMKFLSKTLVGK